MSDYSQNDNEVCANSVQSVSNMMADIAVRLDFDLREAIAIPGHAKQVQTRPITEVKYLTPRQVARQLDHELHREALIGQRSRATTDTAKDRQHLAHTVRTAVE